MKTTGKTLEFVIFFYIAIMNTRRALLSHSLALAGLSFLGLGTQPAEAREQWTQWDAAVTPKDFSLETSNPWGLDPRFLPQRVRVRDGFPVGSIQVDPNLRLLYHIEDGGMAMRYGVSIGRPGAYVPGTYILARKAQWPIWTPTQAMLQRDPARYGPHRNGMASGPNNPLGSRALYLQNAAGHDTLLRVHGTPEPQSIGTEASSGCVRMIMPHINHLYDRVATESVVILHPKA